MCKHTFSRLKYYSNKMWIMKILAISATILALSGCALSPMNDLTQGVKIDTNKFDSIELCNTKKSKVVELIGAPQQEGRQSGYRTASWSYAKASFSGGHESQYVIAFFNNESNIVDYAINPVGLVQITDNCK